jgi:hypothetical protein
MAAEVFSGQSITGFGEDDAHLPHHDWDRKLPDPEAAEKNREALATIALRAAETHGHPPLNEWGPDPIYPRLPEHRYTSNNN